MIKKGGSGPGGKQKKGKPGDDEPGKKRGKPVPSKKVVRKGKKVSFN